MKRQSGITLIELVVGVVVGSIVLAGAYRMWLTHQEESYRLAKKIELRNTLTLASKKLQRSVTLAGLGLSGAPNLSKQTGIGSDTLVIFTNVQEARSELTSPADHHSAVISVADPSIFADAGFVAIVGAGGREIRGINQVSGSSLYLDSAFASDYALAGTLVMPAARERYYSDQDSSWLVQETGDEAIVVATDVRNFHFSFADSQGGDTGDPSRIRTVRFTLVGEFPAEAGAMNTIALSSTAIPRNTL